MWLATLGVLLSTQSANAWWDANWGERERLVFDNSASGTDLDDFPVLVALDSTRIDYSKVQNAGQDLRFVDSDDSTLLDYEIDVWDESGTSYVWVKVPRIDAGSDTDHIWMYYDNAGASSGEDMFGTWSDNSVIVAATTPLL